MEYNHDLILKGAHNKRIEKLIEQTKQLSKELLLFIPYEDFSKMETMINNYDELIEKYCKYAFLLGYTHAKYEE